MMWQRVQSRWRGSNTSMQGSFATGRRVVDDEISSDFHGPARHLEKRIAALRVGSDLRTVIRDAFLK